MTTTLHLCIATGQNTANFIPLKQLAAHTIWILETPDMQKQQSAKALSTALKSALPEAPIRMSPTGILDPLHDRHIGATR